jgi:bifunctional non-homologous end joining protein LigD
MIKLVSLIEAVDQDEAITLYYQEGTSDKVYTAVLKQEGSGWVVNAQWGRRGSTMQTGTKTNSPVSYEEAKKIYDKLVKSKMAKGYEPGDTGPIYTSGTGTDSKKEKEKRKTGTYPQLLNPIGDDEVEAYLTDNSFGAQEKYDGKRIIIDIGDNGVTGINRKGLTVEIPQEIASEVDSFMGETIDGELVGNIYYAFDLLRHEGNEIYNWTFKKRHNELNTLQFGKHIVLSPLAVGETAKRKLYDSLKKEGKEGIVFKSLTAPYKAGRPTKGGAQLKKKFWESISCQVSKINLKRSVGLQLLDGKKLIDVGNVTIPPNYEIPNVGDIVEIKYLYAYKGGSLYQPIYLGKRDDVDVDSIDKLKYKS